MPARNPELPEGTDHIINGAMETGAGTGASTGSSGGDTGFIAGGGDGTGGTAVGGASSLSSAATSGGGGTDASGAPIKQQLRDGVDNVRQQAGDRVRAYAVTGKDKATTALQDLSQVVNDAAAQIDDRLGAQYGDYARRASEAVTGLADTLRDKDVDELFDDAREIVRKSPGVAIGAAAIVGFTLVRLIKAGLDNDGGTRGSGGGNVEFRPEGGRNIDFQPSGGGGSTTGTGA